MIILVDGLNFFMRHYAANPSMTQNGDLAGGVVGFLKGIAGLSRQFKPDQIHVIWEGGGSLRRRAIYSDYKKGRKPKKFNRYYEDEIPDSNQNRLSQVAFLTKCLRNLPVYQHYIKYCEADDVVGYLARYEFVNQEVLIVSSDKDFYQLVNERVKIWSPGQKRLINEEVVLEKMLVKPSNVAVVRSFVGDSSDNIGGVKGAGFKTLAKRFPMLTTQERVNLDSIFTECNRLKEESKVRIYPDILENKDLIKRNFRLMCLDISNLAATQIQQIKGSLEINEKKYDKLSFLRSLHKFGLINFDPSTLFLQMNLLNGR